MRRHIIELIVIVTVAGLLWQNAFLADGTLSASSTSVVVTALPAYNLPGGGDPGGGDPGGGDPGGGIPGGGGDDSAEQPESPIYIPLPPGTISLSGLINSQGVFTQNLFLESEDKLAHLFIDAGIRGLVGEKPPDHLYISIIDNSELITLDKDDLISSVYEFGPSNLKFDTPVRVTIHYNDKSLPEGVYEEELYMAVWDPETDDWYKLQDITIDSRINGITVMVDYFSTFAIFADRSPKAWQLNDFAVYPTTIESGNIITAIVRVTNPNSSPIVCSVPLFVNGEIEAEKTLLLDSEESDYIVYYFSRQKEGIYAIRVGGLVKVLTVEPAYEESPVYHTLPVSPDEPEPLPALSESEEPKTGIIITLYIVSAVVLISAGGLSWYYQKRRRPKTMKSDGDDI